MADEHVSAPTPTTLRADMGDAAMKMFVQSAFGVEAANNPYSLPVLMAAASSAELWAEARAELKLSAQSSIGLRGLLLAAAKAQPRGRGRHGLAAAAASDAAAPGAQPCEPRDGFIIDGVPTTSPTGKSTGYHSVFSGETKARPPPFNLLSLKQAPAPKPKPRPKPKLAPPPLTPPPPSQFNLAVKKPKGGWGTTASGARPDIGRAAADDFGVLRRYLECESTEKFEVDGDGGANFAISPSVRLKLVRDGLHWYAKSDSDYDGRWTNSPLNFLLGIFKYAAKLEATGAQAVLDSAEAREFGELKMGGEPAVNARKLAKAQTLRDEAAPRLAPLDAAEKAAAERLSAAAIAREDVTGPVAALTQAQAAHKAEKDALTAAIAKSDQHYDSMAKNVTKWWVGRANAGQGKSPATVGTSRKRAPPKPLPGPRAAMAAAKAARTSLDTVLLDVDELATVGAGSSSAADAMLVDGIEETDGAMPATAPAPVVETTAGCVDVVRRYDAAETATQVPAPATGPVAAAPVAAAAAVATTPVAAATPVAAPLPVAAPASALVATATVPVATATVPVTATPVATTTTTTTTAPPVAAAPPAAVPNLAALIAQEMQQL